MREEKNQEEGFESEKKNFLKNERVENGKTWTFDSYKSEFKFKHLPLLPIPIPAMQWPHDDHIYAPPRPVSSKNAQCSKLSFLPSLKADYFRAIGLS